MKPKLDLEQTYDKIKEAKEKIYSYIEQFSTDKTEEKETFLKMLSDLNVLPYDTFIVDFFAKEKTEFYQQLKKTEEYPYIENSEIISAEHRGQSIDLYNTLTGIRENIGYNLEQKGVADVTDDMIYESNYEIWKSDTDKSYSIKYKEIVDIFYNWVKENKQIGFHFDW